MAGWMRSRLWSTGALIVIGLISIGYVWHESRESVRLRVVSENSSKARELKEQIDQQFPVGTVEAEVLGFLRREHPAYTTSTSAAQTGYGIPVGQEPSEFWGCGRSTAGVMLQIEGGKLAHTEIARWSTDCL